MIDYMITFFSYGFVRRAVIVGILIAACAAVLGVSLVLKRYSMIGDGLSHVGFGASATALAAGVAPLYVAVPVVILSAFLLLRLGNSRKIKGDAAIAVVSSSALAVGITVAKLSHGMSVDINNYMFGSIYTISNEDLVITVVLSLIVLTLYVLFYNKLFTVTFDESFAKATGVGVTAYNTLLACLTAVTVVIGMRMMGALLISSLLVFPVLTANRVCRSYRAVMLCSLTVSIICLIAGIILSFVYNTPPGATVVLSNLAVFCLFFLYEKASMLINGRKSEKKHLKY